MWLSGRFDLFETFSRILPLLVGTIFFFGLVLKLMGAKDRCQETNKVLGETIGKRSGEKMLVLRVITNELIYK